jgi:hypothetical protein
MGRVKGKFFVDLHAVNYGAKVIEAVVTIYIDFIK